MFVAEAHSFSQQSRLAITLAWVAGYTNILTILTCGVVTAHVTGTTTNLGRDIAEGKWPLALAAATLVAAFFLGAAASGLFTEIGRRRGWESIYVLPIAFVAGLLAVYAVGLETLAGRLDVAGAAPFWMACVATCAMGIQNATITRISSGVVRTTHVTGVVTDLGLETTQFFFWLWDRRHNATGLTPAKAIHWARTHPTPRRLALLASIFGSFLVGGVLGAVARERIADFAMFPPVLFLVWIIYQDISRPIAEILPSPMSGKGGYDLPPELAVFHLKRNARRRGKIHRMPNLIAWLERLPREGRVIVLDLGADAQLDHNAALELRMVVLRVRLQGRRLILAGLGERQLAQLRASWGEDLKAEDVCPDLELAIAHGLMLLMEGEQVA